MGGKLTLDKNVDGGTLDKNVDGGTLIETLQLLAPYLPPDLMPEKVSPSTLQRAKANWTRNSQ
jgi:hypothetical protein